MAKYTESEAIQFINHIAPMIQSEAKARGYLICSTVIAQAIIEGACGKSQLAKEGHNHFGLKAGSSWKGEILSLPTKEEYIHGILTKVMADFRKYPNDLAGVKGYYDFIQAKRYANLKTAKTYVEYAQMLKADGYATSSTYISTLTKTVEKYSLTRFDSGISPTPTIGDYKVGKTYVTNVDLYVRKSPRGEKMPFMELSDNARSHGFADDAGFGILKKGTQVTCKAITKVNGQTWIKIPSGWICAINVGDKVYVE